MASAGSQSSFPPAPLAPNEQRFAVVSRFASGIAAELRALLSPLGREIQALKAQNSSPPGMSSRPPPPMPGEESEDRLETMRRRLASVQDFLSGLAAVGELDPSESSVETDVGELARTAVRSLTSRLERQNVEVDLDIASEPARAKAAPRAIAVLLREMVTQALSATSAGGRVKLTVTPRTRTLGTRDTIDDSGPALPASARRPSSLSSELDPGTYGRPSAVPLYVAAEIAAWQGGLLELGDAPFAREAGGGGLRVTVTFPLWTKNVRA